MWIHPDGLVEEEAALGEVRFPDETAPDGWREIDTTLEARSDGSIQPKAVPLDVELGTGSDELVVFDKGGQSEVGFSLESVNLPTPVLDGPTATYPDVLPGVDASVEVRSGGFEVLWVVKTPEAADLLVQTYGNDAGEIVLPTRLRSKVAPGVAADGSVELKQLGEPVGEFAAPSMWDSSGQVPGARGEETEVAFDLAPAPQGRSARAAAVESTRDLGVVASQQWLTAQERVFPVVIDPTYQMDSITPTFDTWVQNGVTADKSAAADLRIGNDGTGNVARTFLNFNASLFRNRLVRSASLSLYGSYSSTCSQTEFAAYDAGVASTASRWTAQPTIGAKRATSTATVGKSASCPAARIDIDMTAQAKAWSTSSTTAQVGMMLGATNVADAFGWKIFHSSEGQNKPVIALFYNRSPDTPTAPTISGMVSAATTSGVKNFIGVAKPTMSVSVKDADVDTVTAVISRFTSATSLTPAAELCRGTAASGGTIKCTSVPDLPTNSSVWIRALAGDGLGWSAYGPAVEVRYGGAIPTNPTVSCTSANGSWVATIPASESCTIMAKHRSTAGASSPTSVTYRVDGGAWKTVSFTQITADTQVTSFTVTPIKGAHSVEAYAKSPVGRKSEHTLYSFGYGVPTLLTPAATLTTHDAVTIKTKGAPSASSVLQWRVKGTGETWRDIDGTAKTTEADGVNSAIFDTQAALGSASLSTRVSVVLEVRGKYTSGTSSPLYTDTREIIRLPHAFGAGFPTTEIADVEVALWTGQMRLSETDAELATPDGGISITRTYSTWQAASDGAQGVFGPGWVAAIESGPGGVSHLEVVDNTPTDGTLVFTSPDGEVLPFAPAGATRRTGTQIPSGKYLPIGRDADTSGMIVAVDTVNGMIVVTAVDTNGISTVFKAKAPQAPTEPAKFGVTTVTDSSADNTVTYSYDAVGLLQSIAAPIPDGIGGSCLPGQPRNGCRLLRLTYSGTGTATRLATVSAQVNSDAVRVLASYAYTNGRLTKHTDNTTGLTTKYTWIGSGAEMRISSITRPGQAPTNYTYGAEGELTRVTRQASASAGGGSVQIAAIEYDIALPDIPNLDMSQFDDFNLSRAAVSAVAVFGARTPISQRPTPGDSTWLGADLWLSDAEGHTIHNAAYGKTDWQLTAYEYDEHDLVVSAWSEESVAAIRENLTSDIMTAATRSKYNADIEREGVVAVPAGTFVTEVIEPARMTADGLVVRATRIVYDDNETEPGHFLPVLQTITAERPQGEHVATLETKFYDYDEIAPDDFSGWRSGEPTRVTVDTNQNGLADPEDHVRITRQDSEGRTIELRPSGSERDASTIATVYWTALANPRNEDCGNRPEWAGFVCFSGAPAEFSGQAPPPILKKDYSWNGVATTSMERAVGFERVERVTLDAGGIPIASSTTTTIAGVSSEEVVESQYWPQSGLVKRVESSRGTTELEYDDWGRVTNYVNTTAAGIDSTVTDYNSIGDVVKVTTPRGKSEFFYGGVDAKGEQEGRGLLTSVRMTAGSYSATSRGSYDEFAHLVYEMMPGGIAREVHYNTEGQMSDQAYSGPTGGGKIGPWIGWSWSTNSLGQIETEISSESTADYEYDPLGRLVSVMETSPDTSCQKRVYGHDDQGNRLARSIWDAGSCEGPATREEARTFDEAGRPLTANGGGAYQYDALGRQLTIPASDTRNPNGGDIAISYFDDDYVRSVEQGNTRYAYELETTGRVLIQRHYSGAQTVTSTSHYIDESDSPGWVTRDFGGTSSTSVYFSTFDGGLGFTVELDASGETGWVPLTTPRGDVAGSVKVRSDGEVIGPESWSRFSEFGSQIESADVVATYGWLGGTQKASDDLGLVRLGSRLYNPTTGLFSSPDPVPNGAGTSYGYPADPINYSDASGEIAIAIPILVGVVVLAAVGAAGLSYYASSPAAQSSAAKVDAAAKRALEQTIQYWETRFKFSKALLKLVAKPTHTNYRNTNKYVVYRVTFATGISRDIYKYGITSQRDWSNRSSVGRRSCTNAGYRDCKDSKVTTTVGYMSARILEYSLIMGYVSARGRCPVGHKGGRPCK